MSLDPKYVKELSEIEKKRENIYKVARERANKVREKYRALEDAELVMIQQESEAQLDGLPDPKKFIIDHPSEAELSRRFAVTELCKHEFKDASSWDRYHTSYYLHITQKGFKKTILIWTGKSKPVVPPHLENNLKEHGFKLKIDHFQGYIGPN